MQAPKPNITPPKQRPLQATMDALGYDDTLSWAAQTSSGPDTNLAHYPRLMYYYLPDYLGHVEYITDLDGVPYQYFYYTAPMSRLSTSKPLVQRCFSADWSRPLARWGETLIEEKATRPGMHFESPYRFNAKELDEEPTNGSSRTPLKINNACEQTGLYYYGARYYNPMVSVWLGVDPHAENYPNASPYCYVENNPIMRIDPDGRDWYEVMNDETCKMEVKWTELKSQDELIEAGIQGNYLGEAFVHFEGSSDEKLGEDGTLTGKGANPAKVTVYGPGGADDVKTYDGLTVSSDPNKYSMIEEGDYEGRHQQMATSPYGKGSLTYRIHKLDGSTRINPEGGTNKANGKDYMEGIFLHRTNWDGKATHSSQGCLNIDGRQWKSVEQQLGEISSFRIRVTR
jgi:RHS repeat-associated protein